jgi:hypothetical protein
MSSGNIVGIINPRNQTSPNKIRDLLPILLFQTKIVKDENKISPVIVNNTE